MKVLCLISLAILLVAVSSAAVTSTPADSAYTTTGSKAVKVLDSTNTTVDTATGNLGTAIYSTIRFTGSNTSNASIYAFGALWTSASTGTAPAVVTTYTLSKVIKRTINATAAGAAGSETTEPSVQVADVNTANTAVSKVVPVVAAGSGYYAVGVVVATTATPIQDVLTIYTYNGDSTGQAASKAVISAATSNIGAAGTTTTYSYAIDALWFENDYFWVLYEAITDVLITATPAYTNTLTGLYLQGVLAKDGTLFNTAPLAITTSMTTVTGATTAAGGNTALLFAAGSGTNYTNSSMIQVGFKDGTTLKYFTVTKSTWAVASGLSLADVTTGTTVTYTHAGFIASNYTYGILVGNATGTTVAYGLIAYYNGSTTRTTNIGETNITTGSSAALTATTFRYSSGYGLIVNTPGSSASTLTVTGYNASGLVNVTQTTFLSVSGATAPAMANGFVDYNGAVWYGHVNADTATATNAATSAYIGRLVGQVNTYTTTTFGNVLATFAAFIVFVVVSLFMF